MEDDVLRGDHRENILHGFWGDAQNWLNGGDDIGIGHQGYDTINGGIGQDRCQGNAEGRCERDYPGGVDPDELSTFWWSRMFRFDRSSA